MKSSVPEPVVRTGITRRQWVMAAIWWLVLGSIAWAIFSIIRHTRRTADLSEVCQNSATISKALGEFESEYHRYPDSSTAAKVVAKTATPLTLGSSSSNQLFRQLLVTTLKSEKPFFVNFRGAGKPDNVMGDDAHALQAGECGFAYLPGLDRSQIYKDTPILFTRMIPGTYTFERGVFGNRAVVSFADGHLEILPLDARGRAQWKGMDLFDLRQPFWHGRMPDLKWPEERLKER